MITAQIDNFVMCQHELERIFPLHHRELGLFQDRMPLRPQYDEYRQRERDGKLFLATVRVDGVIAAYYVAQVAPGFHYGDTLTGTMDICYIVPEHRNKGLSLPLFRCVEKELRRRGAQVWYSGFKSHEPLGMPELLDALKFQPADTYRARWLA